MIGFFCESCAEVFKASPFQNAWCGKCQMGHILCDACEFVHSLSASQQDHYLVGLEEQIYG